MGNLEKIFFLFKTFLSSRNLTKRHFCFYVHQLFFLLLLISDKSPEIECSWMWGIPFECAREKAAAYGMSGQVSKGKKKKFIHIKRKSWREKKYEIFLILIQLMNHGQCYPKLSYKTLRKTMRYLKCTAIDLHILYSKNYCTAKKPTYFPDQDS